jgi:hypothetical protein
MADVSIAVRTPREATNVNVILDTDFIPTNTIALVSSLFIVFVHVGALYRKRLSLLHSHVDDRLLQRLRQTDS